jgi:hypothetical protein
MLCKIINLGKGEDQYFIILPYTYHVGVCWYMYIYTNMAHFKMMKGKYQP